MTVKKKLIEVALPLEVVNKALGREKFPSQRHRLQSHDAVAPRYAYDDC